MNNLMRLIILIFLFLGSIPTSNLYASNIFSETEETTETHYYDPFEGFNRKMYDFNIFVDRYTLKPLAKGYAKLPTIIRKPIYNFTQNITLPLSFANSLLQLNFKNSGTTLLRFTINSTAGILGLFDIASKMNIKSHKEDFSQTLAKYHISNGPYLVLPFFGPTTFRNFIGEILDFGLDPIWLINDEPFNKPMVRTSVSALTIIDKRESLLTYLDDIEKNSFDPYTAIRSAYFQKHMSLINND